MKIKKRRKPTLQFEWILSVYSPKIEADSMAFLIFLSCSKVFVLNCLKSLGDDLISRVAKVAEFLLNFYFALEHRT